MQAFMLKYCDSSFKSLANNITRASKSNSKKDVHNLRLNIKRMHTILAILKKDSPLIEKNKTVKKINRIFVHSGNLRDIQIEIRLLKPFEKSSKLNVSKIVKHLKKGGAKEKQRLTKQLNRITPFDIILLNQHLSDIIESTDSKEIEGNIKLYVQQLLSELTKKEINEKNLHGIRIHIKNILSSISLLNKCKEIDYIDTGFIRNANDIQQKIGKCHDLCVLIEKIEWMSNLENSFKSIKQILDADKQILLSKILPQLKETLLLEQKISLK